MYNLHTHSLLSDGELLPAEICVRYAALGYKAIAITDHCDYSNIGTVIPSIIKFCRTWPKDFPLQVLPGVELTHVPLNQFQPLARLCRKAGIRIIVGHGETVAEPVIKGTNRACLEADIDILAHPGHISDADAAFAAKRGILLEITCRKSHGRTNKEVVRQALRWHAGMALNHDSHAPEDILSPEQSAAVGRAAGLTAAHIKDIRKQAAGLIESRA